jgi:hypothetical protein
MNVSAAWRNNRISAFTARLDADVDTSVITRPARELLVALSDVVACWQRRSPQDMKPAARGLLEVPIDEPVPEASQFIVPRVVVLNESLECFKGFGVLKLKEFQAA